MFASCCNDLINLLFNLQCFGAVGWGIMESIWPVINRVMRYWYGYLTWSKLQMTLLPSSIALLKSGLVYLSLLFSSYPVCPGNGAIKHVYMSDLS